MQTGSSHATLDFLVMKMRISMKMRSEESRTRLAALHLSSFVFSRLAMALDTFFSRGWAIVLDALREYMMLLINSSLRSAVARLRVAAGAAIADQHRRNEIVNKVLSDFISARGVMDTRCSAFIEECQADIDRAREEGTRALIVGLAERTHREESKTLQNIVAASSQQQIHALRDLLKTSIGKGLVIAPMLEQADALFVNIQASLCAEIENLKRIRVEVKVRSKPIAGDRAAAPTVIMPAHSSTFAPAGADSEAVRDSSAHHSAAAPATNSGDLLLMLQKELLGGINDRVIPRFIPVAHKVKDLYNMVPGMSEQSVGILKIIQEHNGPRIIEKTHWRWAVWLLDCQLTFLFCEHWCVTLALQICLVSNAAASCSISIA